MKKLFKLSLVLCASVLMGVSCSNNNTNPDDTNKTPATQPQLPTFKVVVDKAADEGATVKTAMALAIESKTATETVLETDAETKELKVTFTDSSDKNLELKTVTYEIKSVERATLSEEDPNNKDSGLAKGGVWSVDNKKIKLAKEGTTIKGATDFETKKYDYLKITIKAKIEGYQDSEFVVYVKVTITRS